MPGKLKQPMLSFLDYGGLKVNITKFYFIRGSSRFVIHTQKRIEDRKTAKTKNCLKIYFENNYF